MELQQRSLGEKIKHAEGNYGGFSFAGQRPDGVTVHSPLPTGIIFPNGARSALLLTFDVEGNYGNGTGDVELEVSNYRRICKRLSQNKIPATFNVVGKMAAEHGPKFVNLMFDAGCEVASHGYVHDMNKRYGGDKIYAGHYGLKENLEQISDGITAINKIKPDSVRGVRLPYGHFNEYSFQAMEKLGLVWSSHVGADDFDVPGHGFGYAPFRMQLGDRLYRIVEIPLDSQTYDWAIWMADEQTNGTFVKAVETYCKLRDIPFERTPRGAVTIWRRRILDTIENKAVFTLLCHPINLAVKDERWSDPVTEFLFPIIDELGRLAKERSAWVCTCGQLADFYLKQMVKK
jgi:peptidoglycan/xylan/chitin deacetylase (PgdA/CDA1 family)